MFILRKITPHNGEETNYTLGEKYTVIDDFLSDDEFNDKKEEVFSDSYRFSKWKQEWLIDDIEIFGLIVSEDGEILPLLNNEFNYIMMPNGKTFSNLSR